MGWLLQNLRGRRYGRLKVLAFLGQPQSRWLCLCDCGYYVSVAAGNLTNRSTNSCGCYLIEFASRLNRTHGKSDTHEYAVWTGMITRCENPRRAQYDDYGGRGIQICRRWRNSFAAFLADMGACPSRQHSIERIKNSRGYNPKNCKWATRLEQGNNTQRNRWVKFRGENLSVSQWARRLGIVSTGVQWRLDNGWPLVKALTQPPQKRKKVK